MPNLLVHVWRGLRSRRTNSKSTPKSPEQFPASPMRQPAVQSPTIMDNQDSDGTPSQLSAPDVVGGGEAAKADSVVFYDNAAPRPEIVFLAAGADVPPQKPRIPKIPSRSAMKKSTGARDPESKPARTRGVHFGDSPDVVIEQSDEEDLDDLVLDFLPSMMDVLARLSETHTFVQAVFIPFHYAYKRERMGLDHDRKEKHLFEKMTKAVRPLLQMDGLALEQPQWAKDGISIKIVLAEICERLTRDIMDCCNAIDLYQKYQPLVRYLTATVWSQLFAQHVMNLETRHRELCVALDLQDADVKIDIQVVKTMVLEEFDSYKTPQEVDLVHWIRQRGGTETVIGNDATCTGLVEYQTELVGTPGLELTGPSGTLREIQVKKLREEYQAISRDVESLIRDNMELFANRLELIHAFNQEGTAKIENQADILDIFRGSQAVTGPTAPHPLSRMPSRSSIKKATGAQALESKSRRGSLHVWDRVDPKIDAVITTESNQDLQDFGSAFLDLIPPIMDALTKLSTVHPFVQVVFIPFQFAYEQEKTRRDNDRKREHLFKQMTDAVQALLEIGRLHLKPFQDGTDIKRRLTTICEDMTKDINHCSNIMDLYQKRQVIVKYLTAGTWNEKFAQCVANFRHRNQDLSVALNLRVAQDIQVLTTMVEELSKNFESYKTPHDAAFAQWIYQQGGIQQVFEDNTKCAGLINYQEELVGTYSLELTGPSKLGKHRVETSFTAKKLREEYQLITQDLNALVTENMNVIELSIDGLNRDLTAKVEHTGEHVVKRIKDEIHRGPHERLEDNTMSEVWKGQGWRGSTKTWKLIWALRDHLVELVEMEKITNSDATKKTSRMSIPWTNQNSTSSESHRDAAAKKDLPEPWTIEYLQVRRLRNLHQVLDPDSSGFSTISEVNSFTRGCPQGWSLARWISYWVVGWQASATKYCTEIDTLFAQMVLVRNDVRLVRNNGHIDLLGNRQFIDEYLDVTWPMVIALTSAVERFDAPHSLSTKFQDYVEGQEEILRQRLDKIRYVIDSSSTVVQALIQGDHIERSILMLITVLMRRHLAKMHLCLAEAISEKELSDDSLAIRVVIDVAWKRYSQLLDSFKHQQVADVKSMFEWFSCGLFRNYSGWESPLNREYYRNTRVNILNTSFETYAPKLEDILVYNADGSRRPTPQKADTEPDQSRTSYEDSSQVPESHNNLNSPEQPSALIRDVAESISQISNDTQIDGVWFGFHSDDTNSPYAGMFEICIAASDTDAGAMIFGTGENRNGAGDSLAWTTTGRIDRDQGVKFERRFADGYVHSYNGTLQADRHIISGTYHSEKEDSEISRGFFLKPGVMRNPWPNSKTSSFVFFALETVVARAQRKSALTRVLEHMKKVELYVQDYVLPSGRGTSLLRAIRVWDIIDEVSWSRDVRLEVRRLGDWYQRVERAESSHNASLWCDACHCHILRARILCLQCETQEFSQSVDFDARPACISASKLIDRDDVVHMPTHLLLKIRNRLLLKDHADMKQRAMHCSNLAPQIYSGPNSSSDDGSFTRCLICHEAACTPCWYCLDCEAIDAFVCDACENEIDALSPWSYRNRYRTAVADSGPHNILHSLIRFGVKPEVISKPDNEQMATVEHLKLVELRMTELVRQRYDEIAKRVAEVEHRLDEGLVRVEELLRALPQISSSL